MSHQNIPAHRRLAVTVETAAALASTSAKTIRKEIDSGQLAHFRVGRKILIRRDALEKWLELRERLVTEAFAAMPDTVPEETTPHEAKNL